MSRHYHVLGFISIYFQSTLLASRMDTDLMPLLYYYLAGTLVIDTAVSY